MFIIPEVTTGSGHARLLTPKTKGRAQVLIRGPTEQIWGDTEWVVWRGETKTPARHMLTTDHCDCRSTHVEGWTECIKNMFSNLCDKLEQSSSAPNASFRLFSRPHIEEWR